MKDLVSASQQARENRKKKAKEQLASDDFIKQLQQSENLENSTLRGFKALIMYMEGKTTKTEVVNQLKSVSTPDVDKVVKALEKLEKKTADNKIDLKPLSDDLKKLETQLSKIPKELPKIPEGKDKVEVTNLKAVTTAIANVEKSVKKIKMVAEAPNVSVNPKITVEKPDLEPLQKIFLDLLERINPPQDWEFPVTDLSKLEKEVEESNKKLQVIADKKVPLPPSMAGVIEAVKVQNTVDSKDAGNSTNTPLADMESWTGEWTRVRGQASIVVFALADQALTDYRIEWSSDGITTNTDLLATSDLAVTEVVTAGFYVYYSTPTTAIDNYYRVTATNASGTGQTICSIYTWVYPYGFPGVYVGLDDTLSDFSRALLTLSVGAGVDPDANFVNSKISGRHSANSTAVPLAGDTGGTDHIFRGEWLQWQGKWSGLVLEVFSDVSGQIFIDFSQDDAPVNGDDSSLTGDPIVVSYDPSQGKFSIIIPVQSKWVRLRYINNAVAQTVFDLDTAFLAAAPPLVMQRLDENPRTNNLAGVVKNVESLPDGAGEFRNIGRDGSGPSKNVHVTAIDENVQIDANPDIDTGQISVTAANNVQIPLPTNLQAVRGLSVSNLAATGNMRIGRSTVTAINGDVIFPNGSKDMDLGVRQVSDLVPPYVILQNPGGANSLDDIDGDTEDSNVGVTPINAMFADDTVRAVFNSTSDSVTLSGFDTSGAGVLTNIDSVKIKMIARKESGAAGETVTYQSAGAVDSDSSTSITTPTITVVAGASYYVSFARRAVDAAITGVSNNMGFTGATLISDVSNGNESRLSVYRMNGTPTASGTVTATLNNSTDHDVAGYIVVTNVNTEGTVDTDQSTSGGTVAGTVSAEENGLILQFIASEVSVVDTLETGFVERASDGSTVNNDQSLNISTKAVSVTGTEDWGATLNTNGDFTAIALPLNPADALNPVVIVSHSEGSTVLNQSISIESDTEYVQDITSDAVWTTGLIDSMTQTISPSVIGNADLEVNRLWIEVSSSTASEIATYMWIGDDNA